MLKVAILGIGYWGPNLVRNFMMNPNTEVAACCDLKIDRLSYIKSLYPTITVTRDHNELITHSEINLVAICTPVDTHFEFAKKVLDAGKHVLIEKPMTASSQQAEELINLAEQKNLRIFVDHTFLFTGAVKKIKELIVAKEIGDLYYFDSVRINLGLFQHDVNVLWDLAPHDISIMHYLLERKPHSVVATGADHTGSGLENVAYMTVYFSDNLLAHFHANWLSPVKIRQTLIAGSKKMIVWDDNQPSDKVRIYDKGIEIVNSSDDVYNMLIQYRTGDMYSPKLATKEALATEVEHIYDCINNNKKPLVDGHAGWMVVRILEAAQESIKNRGREVQI